MGQVIDGRWEIERLLGEGGQAQTFLVIDRENGRRVALKRLKNSKRLPRFEQEVLAIQSLNHRHVLRLILANTAYPRPYLVSEFCELGSLEDQKQSVLNLTVDQRLQLVGQIGEGLAAAHAAGIVHRDLKPSNIFLRALDDAVVGDFGVCFVSSVDRITNTSEAVGGRYYMAPELADGRAEQVSPSVDIYAVGKIIYWLLTGRVFDREDHRNDDRLLTNYYPDASVLQVHELLDRMLTLDPKLRFCDGSAIPPNIVELRRLLNGRYPTLRHKPLQCRYCGVGTYVSVGDNSAAVHNFGLQPGFKVPHIFVCRNCGHVEMFKPSYSSNSDWLG